MAEPMNNMSAGPQRKCVMDSCANEVGKHGARGLCAKHYQALRKRELKNRPIEKTCGVAGCQRRLMATGLCDLHYKRRWATGEIGPSNLVIAERGEPLQWLLDHAKTHVSGCLTWPYSRAPDGRATIAINRYAMPAARVMCEIVHGPAPFPKAEAAHRCGLGRQGCVSPACVRWATRSENQMDRVIHGTSNRGERCTKSKLTQEQVLAIRTDKRSCKEIASHYGVSVNHVKSIRGRRSWRWLD
jgi:hypothetical protein